MVYSVAQTVRVRKLLANQSGLSEKEMFGGIALLLGGNMAVGVHGERVSVRPLESFVADAGTTGEISAMPLWAGESVGGVKRVQRAGEIVRELAEQAEELLRPWGK